MKVAIFKAIGKKSHSTDWGIPWAEYCQRENISFEFVDLFKCNAIETLRSFDVLLWHFGQYNYADMLEARSILYTAKNIGLRVFPDFNDAWHFDDKVAEMYALQGVNAPIPASEVFYDKESFDEWLVNKAVVPIVGKLRTGSGSHNVKLLKTMPALKSYGHKMLKNGFNPAPSLLYKASSNVRSSHDWETFKKKLMRAPEFLRTLTGAKRFPHEKGYIYLQEFIPNNGFDLKVVVVGDKCSGCVRPIRSHDFRASGGGEVFFDKKYFTKQIISSAFETADKLGLQCVGFDYVVDNRTGQGVIVEMSYGFSHAAILASGGYWERNCQWHDAVFNAPAEIIKNIKMKIKE